MKKQILSVVLIIAMVVCLTSCRAATYHEATKQTEEIEKTTMGGYFTVVTEWSGYKIVYANDTKVKYLIKNAGYQFGITPLYNADGTLQIYEESEEDE